MLTYYELAAACLTDPHLHLLTNWLGWDSAQRTTWQQIQEVQVNTVMCFVALLAPSRCCSVERQLPATCRGFGLLAFPHDPARPASS